MAIKLKIPGAGRGKRGGKGLMSRDPIVRAALLAFLTLSLVVVGFFSYWYVKYDRIIEQRFRDPVFTNSAKIYAGPRVMRVGTSFTIREIASELRHAGYSEKDGDSRLGSYHVKSGSIEVVPGRSLITVRSRPRLRLPTARFRRSSADRPGTWRLMNWSRNLSRRSLMRSSARSGRW